MIKVSKERSFTFFLLAFIFFIPISEIISVRLLIISVVISVFLIKNRNWRYELVNNGWDLILYFLMLLFGLTYTTELLDGWNVLEKSLSFIMIPLLFSQVNVLDKNLLNRIFALFVLGVLCASVICLGYAIWRDFSLYKTDVYYYDEFTAVIGSHPTYMAYYVCFSIILLLYFISYETFSRAKQALIFVAIAFLSFILMLTAGRSTFVSMLMMSSFFFLKLLYEPHPLRRKIQGITVTIALLVVLLFQSPYYHKVFPGFLSKRPFSLSMVQGDSWERLVLWKSALNASDHLLFGVGTGDYTSVMNDYYIHNNMSEFAESNFNAHNQFIQILFSNGIIGLIALLTIMIRPVLLSTKRQNILGMLTFFPFFIYGISEVFLGRFQGIIFFVLFHQVFIKYMNQNVAKLSKRDI